MLVEGEGVGTIITYIGLSRFDLLQLFLGRLHLALVLLNVLLELFNCLLEAVDLLVVESSTARSDRGAARGSQPLVGLFKVNLQQSGIKGWVRKSI